MENKFNLAFNRETNIKFIPEFDPLGEYEGIKAITYDGADVGNKKTKVFAYLGYPENDSEKFPAVLLVHGGGGTPFLDWVKMWNDRGYVALAMSTEGHFPLTKDAGTIIESTKKDEYWHRGIYGIFEEDGYVDAPEKDNMQNSHEKLEKQWMYHAIYDVISAHNVLLSDSRVDSEKTGIMGVSWGGVITSLTIGYDDRFSFAIPVYGSGYLAESLGNLGEYFRFGNNEELWLAEKRFDNVNMPILWQCKNDDIPFSLNSNSKSYIKTKNGSKYTTFSIVHEMRHAHEDATTRFEPYIFADSVCFDKKRLPSVCVEDKKLFIDNPDDLDIVSLKVYYITEPMTYCTDDKNEHRLEQEWCFANITSMDDIPECACEYYIEVKVKIGDEECITTSQFVQII